MSASDAVERIDAVLAEPDPGPGEPAAPTFGWLYGDDPRAAEQPEPYASLWEHEEADADLDPEPAVPNLARPLPDSVTPDFPSYAAFRARWGIEDRPHNYSLGGITRPVATMQPEPVLTDQQRRELLARGVFPPPPTPSLWLRNMAELLYQRDVWQPAARPDPIPIAQMGPRHKRNTAAWLRRKASYLHRSILRTHAVDTPTLRLMSALEPDEWIELTPLLYALDAAIEADERAGVPDEPEPTAAELRAWRERHGYPADGSGDPPPAPRRVEAPHWVTALYRRLRGIRHG